MEILEYLVRLRGGKEAAGELDAVAVAGEKVKGAFHGIAGIAFGGLAAFAGFEGLKSAVENTQKLVVSASALSKVTGMNVNTSAQWLAVTNAYGISTRTLTMSMKTLSTQTEAALGGTKKSQEAFKSMGITTDELKKHTGSMNDLLGFVSDKFNAMPGGVKKTQVASQLLGRGWQQLIPLLSEGSKGMDDLRKTAEAYGVTLGKNPLENARKLHEAEIKLKLAQTGLQVQLSERLAPAFIFVLNKALDVYKAIRTQIGPAFDWLGRAIKNVSEWMRKHKDAAYALKIGLMVLVGALIAVKVATIASNLALLGSPVGWVILGVAALAAGLVYCWKHFQTFRSVVGGVWGWLKGATTDTVQWVTNAFNNMVHFFAKLPGRISGAFTGIWEGLKAGLVDALNWIIDQVNGVINSVNSVSGSIPFVGSHLHIGTIGHVGGGGGGPAVTGPGNVRHPAKGLTFSTPGHQGAGVQRNVMHGDVVIRVGQHEMARVQKRVLWDAMAANA